MSSTVNMPTVITVQVPGTLTAGASKVAVAAPFAGKVGPMSAGVVTAPTGADLVMDVNVGGTSVGGTLTITAGTQAVTTDPTADADVIDFAEGDLITLDIDSVGSTVAGADLSVTLVLDADLNPTD